MIDETLSPTWDELLLIDDVTVYGSPEAIRREPPTVVIEVFDQDKMVSNPSTPESAGSGHVSVRAQ